MIEIGELSALPLMAHPNPVVRVVGTPPVKKHEWLMLFAPIPTIKLRDPRLDALKQHLIFWHVLARSIHEIGEQREVDILITVCEIAYLKVAGKFVALLLAGDQ